MQAVCFSNEFCPALHLHLKTKNSGGELLKLISRSVRLVSVAFYSAESASFIGKNPIGNT